jgi:predicted RNA-binding protein
MCESHAYLVEGTDEKLIMEDVVNIKVEGNTITLTNIIGEEKTLDAEVESISFLDHRILLRSIS